MTTGMGNTYPDERADRMDFAACNECGNEIIGRTLGRLCRACAFEFGETDGEDGYQQIEREREN